MKEIRVEIILGSDGTSESEATIEDFVRRVMHIRGDFGNRIAEFSISEDTVDENVHYEIVCPLCERVIPQLSYRKITKGD